MKTLKSYFTFENCNNVNYFFLAMIIKSGANGKGNEKIQTFYIQLHHVGIKQTKLFIMMRYKSDSIIKLFLIN